MQPPEVETVNTSIPTTKGDTRQHPPAARSALDLRYAEALAKPVSFYEKKTREIHQAMWGMYEHGYTFQETADYHGYTIEELGAAFATFGIQAMQIVKERNVVSQP